MRGRRALPLAALLGAATLAAFAPVLGNGFIVIDDGHFIFENAQVLHGLTAETARWALVSTEHANWYPLTRLSHLADASLFGMRAGWHHGVSALWHAAGAGVLFLALFGMTGARLRSLVVAGLFAVHPLQVESVAWASERSMVLAGFFFALALLLWGRYARRPGPGRYGAALGALALGLAAKPVGVTLPLVLLLLDFWPLGRLGGPAGPRSGARPAPATLVLEKAPFLLLAAAASSVAVLTQGQGGALWSVEALPPGPRLLGAGLSYARYLGRMFWPADLAVFYPRPEPGPPLGVALAALLLLGVATVLALRLARRRPWLLTGWLWYLGTLLPMVGIVQVGTQSMADRYAYLPLVGVALALVWSAAGLRPSSQRLASPARAAAAAAVLACFAGLAGAQARLWKDSLTLLPHALSVTAGNWFAGINLAAALQRAGRREEAVRQFRAALATYPYAPSTLAEHRQSLARVLADLGRDEEAAEEFRQVVRHSPGHAEAFLGLGNALSRLRRHGEAVDAYREALRLAPSEAGAAYNLGNALLALGRHEAAAAAFREAVRIEPGHARAHNNLGSALLALGRDREAAAACAEAARLAPADPVARANLARALERIGGRSPGEAR